MIYTTDTKILDFSWLEGVDELLVTWQYNWTSMKYVCWSELMRQYYTVGKDSNREAQLKSLELRLFL